MQGVQQYDNNGRLICELCGKAYNKLISHVIQKHEISGAEYRQRFGFCKSFAFLSDKSRELARQRINDKPDIIKRNLIQAGTVTRYHTGHNKPKHVITPQRRIFLAQARHIQQAGWKKEREKWRCIECGSKTSSPKTKRCKICYIKTMVKRNRKEKKK